MAAVMKLQSSASLPLVVLAGWLVSCASAPATDDTPASESSSGADATAESHSVVVEPKKKEFRRPDLAALRAFVEDQVEYPTDQDGVLSGCALTSECGGDILIWLTLHLPDTEYPSAAEVKAALQLQ